MYHRVGEASSWWLRALCQRTTTGYESYCTHNFTCYSFPKQQLLYSWLFANILLIMAILFVSTQLDSSLAQLLPLWDPGKRVVSHCVMWDIDLCLYTAAAVTYLVLGKHQKSQHILFIGGLERKWKSEHLLQYLQFYCSTENKSVFIEFSDY